MSVKLVPFSPLEELQKLAGQQEMLTETPTIAMPSVVKTNTPPIRVPTGYQNHTLSPYALLHTAILENRRYLKDKGLPKNFYVDNVLLSQIAKDMQCCMEEDFNGSSIPFVLLNGEKVYIPVISTENELGLAIPKYAVWCSN